MNRIVNIPVLKTSRNLFNISKVSSRSLSFQRQTKLKIDENSENPGGFLEVTSKEGSVLKFPYQWLRDKCSCPLCKNPQSGLRFNHDAEWKLAKSHQNEDNLHLTWSDGHETTLKLDSLFEQPAAENRLQKVLWNKEIAAEISFCRLKYRDLLSSEDAVSVFLQSVTKYGIGMVEDVPTTIEDSRKVMERFGPIWRTFWGQVYMVVADLEKFFHPSYTSNPVLFHTDSSYYHEGAGLQAFHVFEHKGVGAINCFVDGFYIAKLMKENYPEFYNYLSSTPIPYRYLEERKNLNLTHEDYTFKHHPLTKQITQIRFTPYDVDVYRCHPMTESSLLYKSLEVLKEEVRKEENRHWIHLKPGCLLVTDNWRILHGRSEFTGTRSLCGMYVSRSDYLSRLRSLGLLSEDCLL